MARIGFSDRLSLPLAFALLGMLAAVMLGAVTARMSPFIAAGLLLTIAIMGFATARPLNGLLAAVAVSVTVPYWYGRGGLTVAHLAVALALLWIVTATTLAGARLRLGGVDYAVAALLVAAAIDWWLGNGNVAAARASANTVMPLILYFAGRLAIGEAGRTVLWTLIGAAALASFSMFFEFALGSTVFQDPTSYYWSAQHGAQAIFRPGGVFGSPPAAVTILAMVTLIAIPLLREATGRRLSLARAGIAVMVAAGVITFTRAGWIGFGAGLVTYFFVLRWRGRIHLPRWLALVPVIAVVFLLALPTLSQTNWFQQGVERKGTLAVRQSYWTMAGKLILDSPQHLLFGRGLNSLVVGSRPELGGLGASFAEAPDLVSIGAHNQYIRTLLEQGLVGLWLTLLWLGGTLLVVVRRMPMLPLPQRRLVAGLAAAIVSFLVVSQADTSLRDTESFAIIALLTGLAVTLSTPPRGEIA